VSATGATTEAGTAKQIEKFQVLSLLALTIAQSRIFALQGKGVGKREGWVTTSTATVDNDDDQNDNDDDVAQSKSTEAKLYSALIFDRDEQRAQPKGNYS